ncbi:MAG: hypothetical protein ACP5US_04375 [Candidatus Kryptoniota bacterium]
MEAKCESGMADSNGMGITGSCDLQKSLPEHSYQLTYDQRIASASCCTLKLVSKNVVDNFTDFQNHIINYLPVNTFTSITIPVTAGSIYFSVQTIQPSPPDIITLQSNFRI